MPLPLPEGKKIQISYRMLPADYEMPALEVAPDHYSLCFILHGDRRVITPTMTFEAHAGSITAMQPLLYHKTVPASGEYYESILIKFSPSLLEHFDSRLGKNVIEQIYETPLKSFEDPAARERVFDCARDMLRIYDSGDNEDELTLFRLQSLLYGLLLEIREDSSDDEGVNIHQSALTPPIIEAVYYIEKNYMKNIRIEEAAVAGGYSVSYFSRLFQSQLGLSFTDYLLNIRLKHVKSDLISTGRSITDIAMDNGFAYPGNLSSCFKKKLGMTPMQFRRQVKEQGK